MSNERNENVVTVEKSENENSVVSVDLTSLPLSQIARIINKDWLKINYAARPYLNAMYSLTSVTDDYGMDSGISIVLYFISNASSWRGEVTKSVKAELKRRTAEYR